MEMPWREASRVISFAFVKVYPAQRLLEVGRQCTAIWMAVLEANGCEDGNPSQETRDHVKSCAELLSVELDILGMKLSKASLDPLLESIDLASVDDIRRSITDVQCRFWDEIAAESFLYQSREKLKCYDQHAPFSQAVFHRFPGAEFDIREAANCFALDRHTATVMHSMRVLEVGFTLLGKVLKIKRGTFGWGQDLNSFQNAWQSILSAKPKRLGWKRTVVPQLLLQLQYFKDAWRNHAMHKPDARYGEEEARRVFEHVRDFMILLATNDPVKREQP